MAEDDINLEQPRTPTVPRASPSLGPDANLPVGRQVLAEPPNRNVSLQRTSIEATEDQTLWLSIRNSARAAGFDQYSLFIEAIMGAQIPQGFAGANPPTGFTQSNGTITGQPNPTWQAIDRRRFSLPFPGVEPYALLKAATEVFVMATASSPAFVNNANLGPLPPGMSANDITARAAFDRQAWERLQEPMKVSDLIAEWNAYTRSPNPGVIPDGIVPYLRIVGYRLGVPVQGPGLDQGTGATDIAGSGTLGSAAPYYAILQDKITRPAFLELIWSYWHEEGMLVQTMNAIAFRFQNRRSGPRDPLANLEIDPLRPLNSFLWGWIQDEQHRLSVMRRAYEYDHHYGFSLHGKAVPPPRTADSRTKFVEAFHNLLFQCMKFYNEDDDTTRIADGFPVLNSVREVHILLTEGGHNQYGDLPWNARMEMLMMEWILARPEMREFIGGRPMVAYTEPWMDRVDTMKTLQGWSDTNIMHFRDLGVFGEQILLTIRFGNWNAIIQPQNAANWARFWRAEIQGYIHAYRAVTGVDLTVVPTDAKSGAVRYMPPSYHLRQRLVEQQRSRALPR
jgi:hypothetical protein